MWALILVFLMHNGEYKVETLYTRSQYSCLIAASKALELNNYRFSILAASCSRVKED